MSRYQALADHLRQLDGPYWDADFTDVEAILGRPLPRSAYQYNAWWANQSGGHSQTSGWRDAGWKTSRLDLSRKRVRFEKQDASIASVGEARRAFHHEPADLWDRARAATGISNRDALVEAGLRALIAREAARALAEMGGTMPDLVVPPRERPAS